MYHDIYITSAWFKEYHVKKKSGTGYNHIHKCLVLYCQWFLSLEYFVPSAVSFNVLIIIFEKYLYFRHSQADLNKNVFIDAFQLSFQ